jgi:hypothetical protein
MLTPASAAAPAIAIIRFFGLSPESDHRRLRGEYKARTTDFDGPLAHVPTAPVS